MVPCHCEFGLLCIYIYKKKWISILSRHHTLAHEHVCEPINWCLCECMCAQKKEKGMREGITCPNRNGLTKIQHWLEFLIASQPRWMSDAAVCVNSCLPKKIGKNKLWEGWKVEWIACSLWDNFTTLTKCMLDKESHLLWHFPGSLLRCFFYAVWVEQKQHVALKRTGVDDVFDFVNVWAIYNCGGTRGSERPDGAICMYFLQNSFKCCCFARALPQPEALWLTAPHL